MLAGIPIHTAMKLTIDQDKCIHCHLCEKACFLTRFCGFDSLEGAAEQYCIGCGHCVAVCPRQAITHSGVKSTDPIGPVPGEAEVLNLLMKTRSVRHFKPDPVSRETWNVLRRAAEYSQSGLNAQSIRLTAVEDPDTLSGIRKALLRMYDKLERLAAFPVTRLAARLALSPQDYHAVISETATQPLRRQAEERGEDPVLYGAPALLLLTGPASQTAREDATVLSHNIMMALTALGLGSCYMGGLVLGCRVFKYKPLLRALDLPKGHAVHQALVLGTPTVQLKRMPERKRRKIRFR